MMQVAVAYPILTTPPVLADSNTANVTASVLAAPRASNTGLTFLLATSQKCRI